MTRKALSSKAIRTRRRSCATTTTRWTPDRHRFAVLMDREWTHGVPSAVDVTLLGRYYERFADHAVEIARRVIFQATGATDIPD